MAEQNGGTNGEKEELRRRLEKIQEEKENQWYEIVDDHESRIRDLERNGVSKEDCIRLASGKLRTHDDHENRIRELEKVTAQSIGMGIVAKVIIPAVIAVSTTFLLKACPIAHDEHGETTQSQTK